MSNDINISSNLRSRIDKIVRKLSRDISEDKEVISDFEEEMKINLTSSIIELIKSGKSEDEAFEEAIKRFGDVNEIKDELTNVFNIQGKLAKILLIASIISIVISAIVFGGYKILNEKNSLTIPKELMTATIDKIKAGEEMSNEEISKLLLDSKNKFRYVAIINDGDISEIYPSNFSVEEVKSNKENYLETYARTQYGNELSIRYGFDIERFNFEMRDSMLIISIILIVAYWILFSSWCIVQAYSIKRLNFAWIILFLTLNIIGYILFTIDGKVSFKIRTE